MPFAAVAKALGRVLRTRAHFSVMSRLLSRNSGKNRPAVDMVVRHAHVLLCGSPGSAKQAAMIIHPERRLLGFVDIDLGHRSVRLPIQGVDPMTESETSSPLVSLECDGDYCEIVVRGDAESPSVSQSLKEVAGEALKLMSHRLLS